MERFKVNQKNLVKVLRASDSMLRRWLDYADEFMNNAFNAKWMNEANQDKQAIREMLNRGYRKDFISFNRKRMLEIEVDLEFLNRMSDYIIEFKAICRLQNEKIEAERDTIRLAKMKRQFRPRDRFERKISPLKVKNIA